MAFCGSSARAWAEVPERPAVIPGPGRGARQVHQDGHRGLDGRDALERPPCVGELPATHLDRRQPAEQFWRHDAAPVERGEQPAEHLVALHVVEGGQHDEHVFGHDVRMGRQRVCDGRRRRVAGPGQVRDAHGKRLGASLHVVRQLFE